jgi:hypothetical protein
MYTINTIDDWSCSGKPADMKISETDSTLDAFVLRTYTHRKHPLHRRIAATISALGLILTLGGAMGCDKHDGGQDDAGVDACAAYCDSGSSEGGSGEGGSNHPPNPIDDDSVTPANNTSYTVGDVIPAGFTAPSDPDGDSLEGKIVLSAPSQSFIKEYPSSTLTPGQHYGLDINTSTANAGGPLPASVTGTEYEVILSATDGKGGESKATRKVTLKGVDPDAPVFQRCTLQGSAAYLGFGGSCSAISSLGYALTFSLTTDIPGVIIASDGQIGGAGMTPSDVGLHPIHVEASDGHGHTGFYDNFFFVDTCDTEATFDSKNMLIPEDFADDVAQNCGSGFNQSLKPADNTQPNYVFEISRASNGNAAMTCVWNKITTMQPDLAKTMTMYTPTGQKIADYIVTEPNFVQFSYHNFK